MDVIAVVVDRWGQKPCYSVEYSYGINLFNRNVNKRVNMRYQIDVTEIGRSLHA